MCSIEFNAVQYLNSEILQKFTGFKERSLVGSVGSCLMAVLTVCLLSKYQNHLYQLHRLFHISQTRQFGVPCYFTIKWGFL